MFQTCTASVFEITSLVRMHACTCNIAVRDLKAHFDLFLGGILHFHYFFSIFINIVSARVVFFSDESLMKQN